MRAVEITGPNIELRNKGLDNLPKSSEYARISSPKKKWLDKILWNNRPNVSMKVKSAIGKSFKKSRTTKNKTMESMIGTKTAE